MNRPPLAITAIGWLFVLVGLVALGYHATELKVHAPIQSELLWVLFVRLLALVGGIFVLRGNNLARWLLAIWMAYHVGLSALHSLFEASVHGLLFVVITWLLFRPSASTFFRKSSPRLAPAQRDPAAR